MPEYFFNRHQKVQAMNSNIVRKFILIGIILIGAYLRLSHIELTSFSGDQGRQLQITKDGLESGDIILAGCPSHLGIRHGAILQYLLTYPMIFSDNPEVSVFFLALLSLVAIYMVYRIGNDFFSWRVGIIAAALFSTSHISITIARTLNNEASLSPFFGALFIYALLKVVNYKSAFYSFVLPILTVILVLAHSSNLAVIIFLAIVLLLYKKSIEIKYTIRGFIIGSIFLIPYLLYLRTGGLLELNFFRGFIRAQSNLAITHNPIIDFRGLITFLEVFGQNYPLQKATIPDWIIASLFIFGVMIFTYKVSLRYLLAREKPYLRIVEFPNEMIFLTSFFTYSAVFLFIKAWNPAYYFGQVSLIFVTVAVAVNFIITRLKNRITGYILILSLMIFQSMANISNWERLIIYGDPVLLKDENEVVDFIIRDARNQPFAFSLEQDNVGVAAPHWVYHFRIKGTKPSHVKSLPREAMFYFINNSKCPSFLLPTARFGKIKIYKQKLTKDIKPNFLEELKYSFNEESGWELPGFDDSLWEGFLSTEKIPAKAKIIYIRTVLVIPEGIRDESVKGKINGYLLDAYIDGKKIKLSNSRFILNHGIAEGFLIKRLTHVVYETGLVGSLGPGSYCIGLRILVPEQYFYLDTQTEPSNFIVFNL